MLWFTVWTLLVLGAVAVHAWLVRDLWRKGQRFLDEAGRAGEQLELLQTRVAELEGTLALSTPAPVELQDPAPAQERRALALVARERRRRVRAARHEATYRRWRSFSR